MSIRRLALLLPAVLAAGAGLAAEHRVLIEAMAFTPKVLAVRPGDTIVWENKDLFVHNVVGAGPGANSGNLAPGQSWRYTVSSKAGFDYGCTLHPPMRGRVEVGAPPTASAPASTRHSRAGGTRGPKPGHQPGSAPAPE